MSYFPASDQPPIMIITDHALLTRLAVALEESTKALLIATEQLGNTRYSEADAAVYLGVQKSTIYKYRGQGLPFEKVGRKVTYLRKDLDAFRANTRGARVSAM